MCAHRSGSALMNAIASELERLASHEVDPTDHLPDWLLGALPQPEPREWLADAKGRWGPIIAALRVEASACEQPHDA